MDPHFDTTEQTKLCYSENAEKEREKEREHQYIFFIFAQVFLLNGSHKLNLIYLSYIILISNLQILFFSFFFFYFIVFFIVFNLS